jgi:hypothetical protein
MNWRKTANRPGSFPAGAQRVCASTKVRSRPIRSKLPKPFSIITLQERTAERIGPSVAPTMTPETQSLGSGLSGIGENEMKANLVRWALTLPAVLLMCALGATPGRAQTNLQLTLGTTTGGELNAVGTGSQVIDINDQICSGSTCTFAAGSADSRFPTTSGTYLMTTPSQTAFTLTPGTVAGSYTVSQAAPVAFSYTSAGGTLTGTLQFLSATDSAVASNGVSVVSLVGTLTITGGSLAADLPKSNTMVLQLSQFNSLASLINGKGTLTTQVDFGSITPEPASIFLFGSGLLALGILLRQRRQGVSFS